MLIFPTRYRYPTHLRGRTTHLVKVPGGHWFQILATSIATVAFRSTVRSPVTVTVRVADGSTKHRLPFYFETLLFGCRTLPKANPWHPTSLPRE